MKKLLLFGGLLIASGVFAQYSEDFEGTTGTALPSGWSQVSSATDGGFKTGTDLSSSSFPIASHSRYVGTNDDECDCDKSTEKLISASFTVPTSGVVAFEYILPGGYGETAALGYSTDGGTTITSIQNLPSATGWTAYSKSISSLAGQTIQLVWTYHDDNNWAYGLMIDDVDVFTPPNVDLAMTTLNMSPTVVAGNTTISGTVTSYGADNITSIDITWNDGSGPNTETFAVNLNYGDTYNFTHGTPLAVTAGSTYNVDVCVVATNDAVSANDCESMSIQGATQEGTRLPLMEEFTSSTCPPCYTLNTTGFAGVGMNTYLANNNANSQTNANLAAVKYQVNWPGSGDHAYNSEAGSRVSYYGITGAPTVVVDAHEASGASDITAAANVPAFVDISASHTMNGTTCSVDVTIDPYVSISGATLRIALLDKEYAAGSLSSFSNGETEFHHVFRKFVSQTTVNLTMATQYTTSQSNSYTVQASGYPSQGSFNLHVGAEQEVVVWLQNDVTGEIYNAAISTFANAGVNELEVQNLSVYPNPASDVINVSFEGNNSDYEITLTDLQGRTVSTMNISNASGLQTATFSTSDIAKGSYLINVYSNGVKTSKNVIIK